MTVGPAGQSAYSIAAMRAPTPTPRSGHLPSNADRRVLVTVAGWLAAVVLAAAAAPVTLAAGAPWRAKVEPGVFDAVRAAGEGDFLVVLAEQADLSGASRRATKLEKGRFVVERLREMAARTQPSVLADLAAHGAFARPYWVANVIWARGGLGTVQAIAGRPDVARIDANPWVAARLPIPGAISDRSSALAAVVEANVAHVGAPDLWAAGFTGQGAVVAGADTGVQWDHPALLAHYRGWNGSSASHDHNWHDAIHVTGSACGADSPFPCDDHGHGTHTMGTMVGDDGAGNQVGLAPGAKWIGCRNMNQGNGTPATYTECFQFFLAPTDLAGANPDPALAPDVINNSWICTPGEGCTDTTLLRTVVENVRAAGIAVVASAGNSGSSCSTIDAPPAIYDAAISVAATDNADLVTSFSSRGPVTVDGSGRLKPDLSAPGSQIRSSYLGGGYAYLSGTSMAGPHVAGMVALLVSAAPCLAGDVDGLEAYLKATAVPRTDTQTCGGIPGSQVPNPVYGSGALRAVLPAASLCGIFSDGFESGDTSAWSAKVPAP